nr:unnamed protein product [Callosobruchus analis]
MKATTAYLTSGYLFAEAEGALHAIQDQVVPTRNYKKYILKQQVDATKCRYCNSTEESVQHLISGYSNLAPTVYTSRHDNMGKVLHQEVAIKLDLRNIFVPYYKYSLSPILQNEWYKMYWDTTIITDRPVQHNRPDMVVVDKSEKSCIIRSAFGFLATGDSYSSLMYVFKISKQVVSKIIPEVCEAIIEVLHQYVNLPQGEQEWLNIAKQFNDVWNFPNCVGSVDGKHVVLQAPINTGSEFFNYKSTFSIVLMAVVDADYCFTFADVGCQGRISDGGVIKNTSFYKKLQGNELHLPSDNALPNTEKVLPYVFVADDAFPLEEHIMKPYPGSHQEDSIERIFNYRLSKARRVVENAFGILSVVFRVLRKPMLLEPHKAAKVVLACIYLHNYLRRSKSSRNIYTRQDTFDQEIDGKIIQGSWRQEREANPTSLLPILNIPRKSAGVSKDNRKQFAEYFKTVGRVPWQELYL